MTPKHGFLTSGLCRNVGEATTPGFRPTAMASAPRKA